MAIIVQAINAFKDNYIWAIINTENNSTWVVDPGEAEPVIAFLNQQQLRLSGILITHHHYDHCDGIKALLAKYPISVYGPKHPDILANHIVEDKQQITLADFNLVFEVLAIPGHTLEHVAYYCPEKHWLFCGDTLFSAGCGRIFEGTAEQMYASLMTIAHLPEQTKIYCTHEYTLANLQFAQHIEPKNTAIQDYILQVTQLRQQQKPSLPTNLALEKQVNPFLRSQETAVIKAAEQQAGYSLEHPAKVFAILREWKNHF